jgi:hypothetical protein
MDITTGNGIYMAPTSGTVSFVITNTTASNNGRSGILYYPQSGSANADGVIDNVVATANAFGINVDTGLTSGGATVATISNSIASNNNGAGIRATTNVSASLTLSIDNTSVSGNPGVGIAAAATANVLLGRSVITGNGTGALNTTAPNTFYTFGDNRIKLNTTNISSPLNTQTLN